MFSPFKEGQLVQIKKPKESTAWSASLFFFCDGETKAYMVAATTEEVNT